MSLKPSERHPAAALSPSSLATDRLRTTEPSAVHLTANTSTEGLQICLRATALLKWRSVRVLLGSVSAMVGWYMSTFVRHVL